ncbi:MAG: T9SS type A sorting domain-containing protein [Bacteroidetes bacterium]|nr:T9SS type A sorting domain-containing protein [Bacteroidota bacterium]
MFSVSKIGSNTPPCMPNYELGISGQPCWPLNNNEIDKPENYLEVYPNPARSVIIIKTESKEKRELYNSLGQLLFSTKSNQIDVSFYSEGVYYLKVGEQVQKVLID